MYVHCGTVYNSKDLELTQMFINSRLDKETVAHLHRGILHSHKKRWVRVLHRTWMNLESIILSKLTLEQKTKQHMFSLIGRTIRTCGNREGSITHWGLLRVGRGGTVWGGGRWGGITRGENTRYRWWGHVPMQQSCMICTCTPEPNVQFKKKKMLMKTEFRQVK